MEGVISELNLVRGRGLIQTNGGKQVPFTKASLHGVEFNELRRDQSVTFEIQLGFEGSEAVGVRPSSSQSIATGVRQSWSQDG